ncbi:aspartic proteinase-like protein 2 isoform X3 [Cynara cardunculus var. scolymus]|uniref:Aspartic peptidase n=1 Tax=Cynara cardunculus var. scolymus TaxID=59895 RepID=A0A103XHM6_CYNCS|nr:aspartic proteinase-like protein 2 isoform X3 [Cynara cardunculus var. scolymus]KVH90946.1 Aspartic peptidase [Cynara cardunculus var. scolymus]
MVTSFISLIFVVLISVSVAASDDGDFRGAVFGVNSKFSGKERSLSLFKAHDNLRHLQILASGVDLPLGGTGRPDAVGLYYARIGIGTPPKEYYVQVDTGSDIMWINCIQCHECPKRGYHGLELTLYDPEDSFTGNLVTCSQDFCAEINGGAVTGCKANASCLYTETYGDGSYSIGYFVMDVVQYESVSGDLQTKMANGSVIFGCGARQSGNLGSSEDALDGILGFGKANSSIISQLASSGKVKKMFAHCLDGENGGGIFAIGHVVQPKVNSTPLIPDQPHYAANVMGIEVGTQFLNLSTNTNGSGDKTRTIIDSGTTLAYLPDAIYNPLVKEIVAGQSDLRLRTLHDQYTCFEFSGSVDDGFPMVTFYFENSLSLKVYPHDYLFVFEDFLCFGWQNIGMDSISSTDTILLGDLVLSNKLVLYDLENQTIGWTEYNCSSSIKLRDEITGSVHLVGPHSISSADSRIPRRYLISFLVIALLHHMIS